MTTRRASNDHHQNHHTPVHDDQQQLSPQHRRRRESELSSPSSRQSDRDDSTAFISITKPRPSYFTNGRNKQRRQTLAKEEGWTINKLRYADLKVHGRTEEVQTLERCLERLCSSDNNDDGYDDDDEETARSQKERPPGVTFKKKNIEQIKRTRRRHRNNSNEFVLIDGHSGTGKSTLALTLKTSVTKRKGAIVTGKYDLEHHDQPYGGIIEAVYNFGKELTKIQDTQPAIYEGFVKEIQRVFPTNHGGDSNIAAGEDEEIIASLSSIFPLLSRLLKASNESKRMSRREQGDSQKLMMQNLDFRARPDSIGEYELDLELDLGPNKDRWHYYFCEFFRVMTSFVTPIVIVLDDLQWADSGSLELIEMILSSRSINGLMVVGCYRSNEVDDRHILATKLKNIKSKATTLKSVKSKISAKRSQGDDNLDIGGESRPVSPYSIQYNITELSIGNLEVDDLNRILMDLLAIDDEFRTLDLAQICHRRTLGNPFFFLEFVSMLKDKELLQYNFGLMKWMWDEDSIESHTVATTNVVDLIQTRMAQLPPSVLRILQLAACLGTTFDERLIALLWEEEDSLPQATSGKEEEPKIPDFEKGDRKMKRRASQELLKDAMEELYLESSPESSEEFVTYRWTHDKIHEAALALVHPEKQQELKANAGSVLMRNLSDKELESSIFIVCHLLNSGPIPSEREKRIAIADLNLRAAQRAIVVSSFSLGRKFALKGIEMLPEEDCWKTNKSLTLDLYSTAVELENVTGHVEEMHQHCNVVLQQKSSVCSFMEKLRVYYAMIDSYANLGREIEARDLCFQCLSKFGCIIPSNPAVGWPALMKGLRAARKEANDLSTLISLEKKKATTMKDSEYLHLMMLLDKSATICYRTHEMVRATNVAIRMFQLSISHGICEFTPVAFSLMGSAIVRVFFDFEAGAKYARFSEKLLQTSIHSKTVEARCMAINLVHVDHWTKPIASTLAPLLQCYKLGLLAGDNESAAMSIVHYCISGFLAGKPLVSIANDLEVFTEQMAALQKRYRLVEATALWKFVLYLMSSDGDGSVLDLTDRSDFLDFMEDGVSRSSSVLAESTFLSCLQAISSAFTGDYKNGARCALKRGDDSWKNLPNLEIAASNPFYKALSLVAQAQRENRYLRNRRRYKREAIRQSKIIKTWVRKGNPDLIHQEVFIKAELSILNKKSPDETKRLFRKAITHATRAGIIHEAALANERYSHYLLHTLKDKEEATFYFKEAKQLYTEWGAHRKVKMMESSSR